MKGSLCSAAKLSHRGRARRFAENGERMEPFRQVGTAVAPVLLLALIGFAWRRGGWAYDTAFVTRLSMTVSIPCLIFMALVRSDVDPRLLRDTVLASTAAYVAVGLVVWGLVRLLDLDVPTYWAPLTFGNTGNIGLPVALFAFGQAGFDFAVVIFAVMAIISFTFGIWVVAGGGSPLNAIREPLVWATLLGVAFLVLGWSVPVWVGATLDLVGQMAIPLMLITLGVAIAGLQPRALGRAFWLCVVKLAICVAAPLAVGLAFGLPRLPLGVLVLQVASPVAVTSYMLAAKYEARADEVAGLVVVSTLVSIPAIPLLLAFFV
jgi:predicted permease